MGAGDSLGCRVVDHPCWRVECVSDDDPLKCFVFVLVHARLVDVCICRAAEGLEVKEAGCLVRDHESGNTICSV